MDDPTCSFCWGVGPGPLGLADILVQPCACSHLHLSCLHTWQLRRMGIGRDPSRCDICRQPYQVPEAAWVALEAAGGVHASQRQAVAAWRPTPAAPSPEALLRRLTEAHQQINERFDDPGQLMRILCQRRLRLRALQQLRRQRDQAHVLWRRHGPALPADLQPALAQLQQAILRLYARLWLAHWMLQGLATARSIVGAGLFFWLARQWCGQAAQLLAAYAAAPSCDAGADVPASRLLAALWPLLPAACTSVALGAALKVAGRPDLWDWRLVPSSIWQHAKRSLLLLGAVAGSLVLRRWAPGQLAPMAGALADVSCTVAVSQLAFYPAVASALDKPLAWCSAPLQRLAASAAARMP
ncbi:hypothetical protein ABPG75_002568 [Micractinium tetrahymenae]